MERNDLIGWRFAGQEFVSMGARNCPVFDTSTWRTERDNPNESTMILDSEGRLAWRRFQGEIAGPLIRMSSSPEWAI